MKSAGDMKNSLSSQPSGNLIAASLSSGVPSSLVTTAAVIGVFPERHFLGGFK